ncbi:prolyl oligopeptidase family serine peptidase [Aquibacillus koreensis]|uniref:Prolyl oligopeptidase family serine peptidase n=1 Tax=Aquibacillus koreensis TaxID=279446 RepID=A0A9X4AJ53_9BACI|nr:alpha/beta fold hydrolase [Aquibacillus koreensis]MCT2534369.1 prolyl oligopeptidase family serine peptidase [Aquibacillus koreensis]MDC3421676.1 prolyl oligopeptidase family serine peptidase [Aquibacillus koreensis]
METETRRQELYELLGELPSRSLPISSQKIAEKAHTHYVLETWLLDLNGVDLVPAYFVRPINQEGPFPTIIFNHSHGGNYELGKDELIKGNTYLQDPPYAEELAKQGYAVLCIDAWGFGSRRGKTEGELFKEALWSGEVLWGKMVYDTLRAIDYVTARDDVDPDRLGTMGISMGSVMSWWIAALDTRIKVCVDLCGLVDFHTLIEQRGLDHHGIYFYVPKLIKHFTTADINRLIAPRPHLSLNGNDDMLTPRKGLDIIDEELKTVYLEEGVSEAWKLVRYNIGHFETAAMRKQVIDFFKKWF